MNSVKIQDYFKNFLQQSYNIEPSPQWQSNLTVMFPAADNFIDKTKITPNNRKAAETMEETDWETYFGMEDNTGAQLFNVRRGGLLIEVGDAPGFIERDTAAMTYRGKLFDRFFPLYRYGGEDPPEDE